MNKNIDILIINNAPAFYKVKLYNELAKHCKIHVVFIGLTNQVVINDSLQNDIHFSYELIAPIQIEQRNHWKTFKALYKTIKQYDFKRVIYGGYSEIENILLMFLTSKKKNCLQFESSIHESKTTGIKALLKKIILSRISTALPSGKLNADVFKVLKFNGEIIETGGVGIFHKPQIDKINHEKHRLSNYRYIYVGRLIPVKNVEFIISVFNKTNKPLTIVGEGYLKEKLQSLANSNITFTGFVPNNIIHEKYSSHDIFILPSISESWGLVVEEAIYCGLPVLVSNRVGCSEDMVVTPQTGLTFSPYNEESLIKTMHLMENNINFYKENSKNFDFKKRDKLQVDYYLDMLRK